MATVLVTGGAGFIGSHLVDRMVERGDQVVVLDDLSTGDRANVNEEAVFVNRSINDPSVKKVLAEWKPEIVFHLAAQISVPRSVRSPALDATINILGSLNVLRAAQASECGQLIFASSGGAVYGEPEGLPVAEDHPIRPLSPYGVSKAAFEMYASALGKTHGMRCSVLRLANVYGPRQSPLGEAGVVSIFANRMLEGRPVTIFGDGTDERDYVYVGDVVDAMVRASEAESSVICNIGTGIGTPVLSLFEWLAAITRAESEPEFAAPRPGDISRSRLDSSKAQAVLGWRPRVSLDEGIARTVEYLRAAGRRS